jgi:hypothetical protein
MSPNPASKVRWNGNYIFGNNVLTAKPAFGSAVAAAIAGWSITEAHLGRIFATLVGAKQPVTMSMYEAIRSFEVQRDLLRAAARDVLPRRYAIVFEASLNILTKAAADRNKFAHWVWGASADPGLDALFLVEPKHFWKLTAIQIKYWKTSRRKKIANTLALFSSQPRLNHDHIYVYRLTDLNAVGARIERSYRIAETLRQFVESSGSRRRLLYQRLCSEGDIQKAVAGMKQKVRKRNPRPPRAQRDKAGQA